MKKQKILVIYYSRTGTTAIAAEKIAKELKCDIYPLIDFHKREGAIEWLLAGRDALNEKMTKIKEPKINLENYSSVIIGTPNWAGSVTPAIRTFIFKNKSKIKNAAFFCTAGGNNPSKIFIQMEKILGKKPLGTVLFKTADVRNGNYLTILKEFCKKIK